EHGEEQPQPGARGAAKQADTRTGRCNGMKPFEDELHRALRRRDPPPGFASRVMARVERQAAAKVRFAWLWRLRTRLWSWGGEGSWKRSAAWAAAMLALAVSVVAWRQHRIREEQRQGELARAQVMEALHVASIKLHRVRSRVRNATKDGGQGSSEGRSGRAKPEAALDLASPILD